MGDIKNTDAELTTWTKVNKYLTNNPWAERSVCAACDMLLLWWLLHERLGAVEFKALFGVLVVKNFSQPRAAPSGSFGERRME